MYPRASLDNLETIKVPGIEPGSLCCPACSLVAIPDWTTTVESSWNVMAHGDAREGKWRGNWRMEWVASTLHTTSEHGVASITTADAHISVVGSRLNWSPRRFKWTRPFSPKDEIWFMRVCHHVSNAVCLSSGAGTVHWVTLMSHYQGTMHHGTANSKVKYQYPTLNYSYPPSYTDFPFRSGPTSFLHNP